MTNSTTNAASNQQLEPCAVCKFHWNLTVMPGELHNPNCPHFHDAEKGCTCQGCGQHFKVDINVAEDLWGRIKPEGPSIGSGLLCGRCIFARIEALSEFDHLELSRVSDGGGVAMDFQRRLYDECVTANWDPERKNTFAEEIAHLHEELSEAFRAFRRYKDFEVREVNGKLEGVPIEFADVLIGMFYNAELYGFDLLEAVERKHQFNLGRNYVAEGRQLHAPATTPSPDAARDVEQCPATCADFSMYVCDQPHRCVLDAGHPFDPLHTDNIHQFETHQTTVRRRS